MAKKYLSSHSRARNPPAMRLTDRDKEIVKSVYQYRLLSSHQIEALHFWSETRSRRSSCQSRLQKLYHHRFLNRLSQTMVLGEGKKPAYYYVDAEGKALLLELLGVEQVKSYKPKSKSLAVSFLNHMMLENDFRIVISLLAKRGYWEIVNWLSDADLRAPARRHQVPKLRSGSSKTYKYPDGYFCVRLPNQNKLAHFFIEIDTGTTGTSKWKPKVKGYNNFRLLGGAEKHLQTTNFRILTVTSSPRRLESLKEVTEREGGNHYYWFITKEMVDIWNAQAILSAHWQRATRDGMFKLFP